MIGPWRRRRQVADRSEIMSLQLRYASACDRADVQGIAACFSPSARCTYNGERLEEGPAAVTAYLLARGAMVNEGGAPDFAIHLVGNVDVTWEGPAAARSTTYGVRYVGRSTGAGSVLETRGLLYEDRLVRHAGRWVIDERELRGLWETTQPAL